MEHPIATALPLTGLEAPHAATRCPNASRAPGSKSAGKAGMSLVMLVQAASAIGPAAPAARASRTAGGELVPVAEG